MFKFNYSRIICIVVEPLIRFSSNNFAFSFFRKQSIFPPVRKLNKKTSEIILEKPIIHDSMRFHLLFPMVKITGIYPVSIKSYSKHTHEYSCYHHKCGRTRSYEMLVLWYQLNSDAIAQKNRASFSLSRHKKRKFPQAFYTKIRYLRHYFWVPLSIYVLLYFWNT